MAAAELAAEIIVAHQQLLLEPLILVVEVAEEHIQVQADQVAQEL